MHHIWRTANRAYDRSRSIKGLPRSPWSGSKKAPGRLFWDSTFDIQDQQKASTGMATTIQWQKVGWNIVLFSTTEMVLISPGKSTPFDQTVVRTWTHPRRDFVSGAVPRQQYTSVSPLSHTNQITEYVIRIMSTKPQNYINCQTMLGKWARSCNGNQ